MTPTPHLTWSVSRRSLLKAAGITFSGMLAPAGLAASARQVEPSAVGSRQLAANVAQQQNGPTCGETLQGVLQWAATLEAVALTYYYNAITAEDSFFRRLSNDFQLYLRAMLAEEQAHYDLLSSNGATPVATAFFFPANSFGFDDFSRFLETQHTLETTSIGLYLVAARRCGELDQVALATLCGQLAGVEAEHRVIGREMSLAPPDPRNDLCFQRATLTCVSQAQHALAPFLQSASGTTGPVGMPSSNEVAAAVGDVACTPIAPASPAACTDSVAALLDTAAQAEAVGIAFYYAVVRAGFFSADDHRQWYLQAALDEERNHLDFLLAHGAATPPTQCFFPDQAFTDQAIFLEVLDTLENLFIGAYLVAMQQFARLGQPLLAQIAGQILGVEAEHRALGRVIARQRPPHDRCLEPATFTCLAEISGALAPFVAGSLTHTRATSVPMSNAIAAAVGRFGCTPVQLATAPPNPVYLPLVKR